MGVYAATAEAGLIPRDLAVMGFDNQEVIAAHLRHWVVEGMTRLECRGE